MDYYRIGLITRPHGVHGSIKLMPLTDSSERFFALKEAYLEERPGSYKKVTVSDVSVKPDAVYLHISDADTREKAEMLRGKYLCVDRAHRVKLPADTYFIADLIGCEAFDTQGNAYGKLVDVMQTGANDVYVLKSRETGETLVPALKKVLAEVDTDHKRIVFKEDVLKEVAVFED